MSHRFVRRVMAGGLITLSVALMAPVGPAHATVPGENGQIAYTFYSGETLGLYMLNADGTPGPNDGHSEYCVQGGDGPVSWSPDGSRVSFNYGGGIATVRADCTDTVQLTVPTDWTDADPAWSPDGRFIYYSHKGQLRYVSNDGDGQPVDLLENPDPAAHTDHSPVVSSRNELVFQRDEAAGGTSLYRYEGPDAPPTLLVVNGSAPDFSPDGTKIAYTAPGTTSGNNQVWVADADGTNAVQLTQDGYGASRPAWSPDGNSVTYVEGYPGCGITKVDANGEGNSVCVHSLANDSAWQPVNNNSVDRVWGQNAIGTGVAASQWNYADHGASDPARNQAKAVVLSRSDAFYDALAGSALAVDKQAPLLITPPDSLDSGVRAEIQRVLGSSGDVYLLGGTEALSSSVEDQLSQLGYTTHRLAGSNVFSTAIAIDDEITGGAKPTTAIVATGMDYYDALAAGAAAGANPGTVLVLTNGSSMPSETAGYLNGLNPNSDAPDGTRIVAAGGPGEDALVSGHQDGMMPSWPADPPFWSLNGDNAMDTAVQVARFFFAAPTTAAVATFDGWYDALTGGAMVGAVGGPLLISQPDSLYGPVADYLSQNSGSVWDAVILGGTAAMSDDLVAPLGDAISVPGRWTYNSYSPGLTGTRTAPSSPVYGPTKAGASSAPGFSTAPKTLTR